MEMRLRTWKGSGSTKEGGHAESRGEGKLSEAVMSGGETEV